MQFNLTFKPTIYYREYSYDFGFDPNSFKPFDFPTMVGSSSSLLSQILVPIFESNTLYPRSTLSFKTLPLNFYFYFFIFTILDNYCFFSHINIFIKFPSSLTFTIAKNDLENLKYLTRTIADGEVSKFTDLIVFNYNNEIISIMELIEKKSILKDDLLFFFTEDENSYLFGFRPIKPLLHIPTKNQNYNYALSKPFLSHPFLPNGTQVTVSNYNQTFTILDSILVQNQKNLFDPFYLVQNQNNQFLVKHTEIKEV